MTNINNVQNSDFYRLNIDFLPLCEREMLAREKVIKMEIENVENEIKAQQENVSQEMAKPKNTVIYTEEKKKSPIKTKISFKNWFKAILRFSLATAVIFIISFSALNFRAYREIVKNKIKTNFTNSKADILSVDLAKKEKIEESPLPINVVRDPEKLKKDIPKLVLEVTPPDNRLIIPKIKKNVPIVETSSANLLKKEWSALEKDILLDLRSGVVHFPGTAIPGHKGNVFITGHSSYYPWDSGKYKEVFALLPRMEIGDEFIVFYNQKKFIYKIFEKKVVKPTQMEILKQSDDFRISLMTCVPVGTNLKRLVVVGKQI